MKKGLKKATAFALAALLLVTSVPNVLANATTSQDKLNKLVELSVIFGEGDGVDGTKTMTRYRSIAMMLRLKGLEEDMQAFDYEGKENFADAAGKSGYVQKLMAYIKANPELGVVGYPDGTFKPLESITAQEHTRIMLEVLGYEAGTDYNWSTVAEKAVEVGLATSVAGIEEDTDFNVYDLATLTYDGLSINAKGDNITLGEKLNYVIVETVKELEVTASATGAKKLTVEFNQEVDSTKATFAVKKGSVNINFTGVEFAADNKSAEVTLASKLTEGSYDITVTGLSEEAKTATVVAENEKVGSVDFANTNLVLTSGTTAEFKATVLNQYGEDITSTKLAGLTITPSVGAVTARTASTGIVELTAGAFAADDKVTVSLIDATSGKFKSATLTVVAAAAVAEIEIASLYHADDETLDVNSTATEFKLVIDAKDQYGNDVTAGMLTTDTIVTVSDTTKFNVGAFGTTTIDGESKLTLPLAGPITAGTATVNIISKSTGDLATMAIEVKAAAKVDTLTISAPSLVVAGEKVNIPFEAVDQFGNAITKEATLTAGMNSLTTSAGAIAFQPDYVNNTAVLELDLTGQAAAGTVIITGVTGTNELVQLTLSMQAPATPSIIESTGDFVANMAINGTATLDENDIVVKDQYGRVFDMSTNFGDTKYVITAVSSDAAVTLGAAEFKANDDTIGFTAAATKGSAEITLELAAWTDTALNPAAVDASELTVVSESTYTFTSKVVAKEDIVSYEIADYDKLYHDSTTLGTHGIALTVYGTLENGDKVTVPASFYTVTDNDTQLTYAAGNLDSVTGYVWASDETEREVPVIVTVDATSGPVILIKNVTIYKKAPEATTYAIADGGNTTVEDKDNYIISATAANIDSQVKVDTEIAAVVSAKDQYGVAIAEGALTNIITNLPAGKTIATVAAGETFNVTTITADGTTMTFKVIVK